MIRPATHADVDALVALGARMHAESPRFSRLTYSRARAGDTLHAVIDAPLGFAWLAERDRMGAPPAIVGGLVAIATPFWASEDLVASDLALFVAPEARGGIDAVRLVNRYRLWARDKGVVLCQLGVTTGVATESTVGLLERMGLQRCGVVLEDC